MRSTGVSADRGLVLGQAARATVAGVLIGEAVALAMAAAFAYAYTFEREESR